MGTQKSYPRSRRVADQIQRTLSELVRREVKDPRLGPITLTDVEVSRDLSHAKVFYAVLGGTSDPELAQAILDEAAPLLRGPLGRALHLRHSPELRFVADDLIERGARLTDLIRRAVEDDAARHVDEQDPDATPDRDRD
ncbi:MAG TPA: 30S ribosome-binding factor RbfA [Steroidobacteraceae bacterium]|nr:30S ribosome-binding factor RbfA [Steroidobacteraceae bacterium]